MPNGYRIKSGNSADYAAIDSNGFVAAKAGVSAAAGGFIVGDAESDPGSVLGIREQYAVEINSSRQFRVAYDNILFSENFPAAALNTAQWNTTATTMTVLVQSGFVQLNAGAGVAVNTNAQITSWKAVPFLGTSTTYTQFRAKVTGGELNYKVMEIGIGYATGIASPTDAVCFRWTGAGELRGVLCVGGWLTGPTTFEYYTPAIPIPEDSEPHFYIISYTWHTVEFWIDDILVGTIEIPGKTTTGSRDAVALNRLAAPLRGAIAGGPVYARVYVPNVTGAIPQLTAPKLLISNIVVTSSGDLLNRSAGEMAVAAWGGHCQGGTSGMATVTNQNNVIYNADVAVATLSNTAAGYSSSGGLFNFVAVVGADTDYALFSVQIPAQTNATQYRNLYITDVKIDTVNTVIAVATTPTIFEWALIVGSTAVSLATADAAATRAYRRIPLGSQELALGAAVGAVATPGIQVTLQSPAMCPVGLFYGILLKIPVGTNTATEVFRGSALISGYWGL